MTSLPHHGVSADRVRDTGAAEQSAPARQGQTMNPYIIIEDARARNRDLLELAARSRETSREPGQVRDVGHDHRRFLTGIQRLSRRVLAFL